MDSQVEPGNQRKILGTRDCCKFLVPSLSSRSQPPAGNASRRLCRQYNCNIAVSVTECNLFLIFLPDWCDLCRLFPALLICCPKVFSAWKNNGLVLICKKIILATKYGICPEFVLLYFNSHEQVVSHLGKG